MERLPSAVLEDSTAVMDALLANDGSPAAQPAADPDE
jgi:hypothetical protein